MKAIKQKRVIPTYRLFSKSGMFQNYKTGSDGMEEVPD